MRYSPVEEKALARSDFLLCRRASVIALRREGLTVENIAAKLLVSPEEAQADLDFEMRKATRELRRSPAFAEFVEHELVWCGWFASELARARSSVKSPEIDAAIENNARHVQQLHAALADVGPDSTNMDSTP